MDATLQPGRDPDVPPPTGAPAGPAAAVLTTDERQVACARALARRGWRVAWWGRPVDGLPGGTGPEALAGAAVIAGPVTGPPSAAMMAAAGAAWAEPAAWPLRRGALYIGGRPGPEVAAALAAAGGRACDLLADEPFAAANAWPTAEGAVLRAQLLGRRVVAGRRAVVLGYGRCGRALARLLQGFGARVTVVARRAEHRQEAAAAGLAAAAFPELAEVLSRADLVFNTVPAPVLGEAELRALDREALVIDIASRPGGVDWDAARRLGIRAHLEPGLPARFFPETAGEILAEAVARIAGQPARQQT